MKTALGNHAEVCYLEIVSLNPSLILSFRKYRTSSQRLSGHLIGKHAGNLVIAAALDGVVDVAMRRVDSLPPDSPEVAMEILATIQNLLRALD